MILKCYNNKISEMHPSRMIYINDADKSLPRKIAENIPLFGGIFGGIFDIGGAAVDVVGAGADVTKALSFAISKLAVSFSTLIDLATYGIAKGSIEAVDGFKSLINWIKNHKEMQEPKDLDEKGEIMFRYLNGADLEPDPKDSESVKKIKNCDYNIAVFDILLQQVNTFYSPVMKEIKKIDAEIAQRERLEYENRSNMVSLKSSIDSLDLLINGGHINAASKAQFTIERNIKMRNLKLLEQNTDTKNVKWSLPQVQETEFPIGSGRFIRRYIPGEEVNVDLHKVRDQLNIYASGAKPFIQTYVLEKGKYLYRKGSLEESMKADKKELTAAEKMSLTEYNVRLGAARDAAIKHFDDNLDPSVTPAVADTNRIKKKDIEKLSYLANDSFSLRKTIVSVPQEHQDFVLWKYSKIVPKRLLEFGCSKLTYASGPAIVKKAPSGVNHVFEIKGDGSVVTGFPDGTFRKLPLNQYAGRKDAWNPPMP